MIHNTTADPINFYQSMAADDLYAERQRLLQIKGKMTTEWMAIRVGEPQYLKAAERNYARLDAELRLIEMACKQQTDCATKRFTYSGKRDAARKAADLRKRRLDPAWTYYKCPFCKEFHITKSR